MKLIEIEGNNASQQQVKSLKATAMAAKDRAKRLKAQADVTAQQLKLKQARDQQTMVRKASSPSASSNLS